MAHFKNRKPKAWRGCCWMCDRGGGRCESVESKREQAVLAEDPLDLLHEDIEGEIADLVADLVADL